jgi:hypothetical protein
MDSKEALSFITARYRKAVEQLDKEYNEKLIANGGMALFSGPLFQNEPSTIAAYLDARAWRTVEWNRISDLHTAEIQVWFDCYS